LGWNLGEVTDKIVLWTIVPRAIKDLLVIIMSSPRNVSSHFVNGFYVPAISLLGSGIHNIMMSSVDAGKMDRGHIAGVSLEISWLGFGNILGDGIIVP
jgi:hypothetical protein